MGAPEATDAPWHEVSRRLERCDVRRWAWRHGWLLCGSKQFDDLHLQQPHRDPRSLADPTHVWAGQSIIDVANGPIRDERARRGGLRDLEVHVRCFARETRPARGSLVLMLVLQISTT